MSDLTALSTQKLMELALYWANYYIHAHPNQFKEETSQEDALRFFNDYHDEADKRKREDAERRNPTEKEELLTEDVINIHNIPGNVPVTINAVTHEGGLAPHRYVLTSGNEKGGYIAEIDFQCVNPDVHGIVGVTIESLVAACVHRLNSYQDTPQRCRENAIAITHFEEGILRLNARTLDRVQRQVKNKRES